MTSSLQSPLPLFLAVILLLSKSALPQTELPAPKTVEEALHQMFDSAGVIFTGEVTAIRSLPGENGSSGVVEIDFKIDAAIRGCNSGSIYTLREWPGLWAGGDQRYPLGQHFLMLLHAPSPSGMASPVEGMTGAIPIRATTSAPQIASSSTATTPVIADLRWIGTHLLRPPAFSPSQVTAAASMPPTQSVTPSNSSVAAQQAPVSVVLDMFKDWQHQAQP